LCRDFVTGSFPAFFFPASHPFFSQLKIAALSSDKVFSIPPRQRGALSVAHLFRSWLPPPNDFSVFFVYVIFLDPPPRLWFLLVRLQGLAEFYRPVCEPLRIIFFLSHGPVAALFSPTHFSNFITPPGELFIAFLICLEICLNIRPGLVRSLLPFTVFPFPEYPVFTTLARRFFRLMCGL